MRLFSQLTCAGLGCPRRTTSRSTQTGRETSGPVLQTLTSGSSGQLSRPGFLLRPQRSQLSSTATMPAWCEAAPALNDASMDMCHDPAWPATALHWVIALYLGPQILVQVMLNFHTSSVLIFGAI